MSNAKREVRDHNCDDYFCLSLSLTYVLVKLPHEDGLEIFYIPSNCFSITPQILNEFHLEFKHLDLRTWFSKQMYLSSMKQMPFKGTLF